MKRQFTAEEKKILREQREVLRRAYHEAGMGWEEPHIIYCECGREADQHLDGEFFCDECVEDRYGL